MAVFPQQSCVLLGPVALPLLGLDLGKGSVFKPYVHPTVAYSNIYFGEGHFKGMEYRPPTSRGRDAQDFASRLDCVRLEGVGG